MAKMNWDNALLKKMIDEGYVGVQKHPLFDLHIYNYTPSCQFDWVWNEVTMQCRGLILDGCGNVVARPFRKFFSLDQLDERVPDKVPYGEPFEVFEKMDGSLGLVTNYLGRRIVATRGSFESDQAKKATQILDEKYPYIVFPENTTYLFEVIYKYNRIVVDYGETEDLVLIAIIDNETGKELPLEDLGFPIVPSHQFDDWRKIYEHCKQSRKDTL